MSKKKHCNRCGNTKPIEEFSKNRSKKDGLADWCKSCVKIGAAQYYLNNADDIKAKQRQAYKENPGPVLARCKEYRSTNPEKVRAYNKKAVQKYRDANPEKVRACINKAQKKWRGTINGHLHQVWYSLNQRCTDLKQKGYEKYKYLEIGFNNDVNVFVEYCLSLDIEDIIHKQIHRLNNNLGYIKGNITFLTRKEHCAIHDAWRRQAKEKLVA